ncbi:MAG: hypothetical protein AAGD35_23820, partial [Actinomycetota bacterium]
ADTLGAWRGPMPCVSAVSAGNGGSQAAPTGDNATGYLRFARTFYDNVTARNCNHTPDKPVATRVEAATAAAGGSTNRLTTTSTLDARGRVTAITDPEGNRSTQAFDPVHGQVTATTNPLGWSSGTTYDAWRRPTTSTDVNGRTGKVTYDVYSRPLTVRTAKDDAEDADTSRYAYQDTVRPRRVVTSSRLDGDAYTDSAVFYDGFGRTVLSRWASPNAGETYATASYYNNMGQLQNTSATYSIGTATIDSFAYPAWADMTVWVERLYNARGDLTRAVHSTEDFGRLREDRYDYGGFATTHTDPNGHQTRTTSNGLGQTTTVEELAVDPGDVSAATTYTHSVVGDLTRVVGPDGATTNATYDLAGRKLTLDDPDTGQWSYVYDRNSRLSRQLDPSGTVTDLLYDALGRKTRETIDGTRWADWSYDPNGNLGLLKQSVGYRPEGDVTQKLKYDTWGQLGNTQTLIPKAVGEGHHMMTHRYSYRDDGQLATTRLPKNARNNVGETVTYSYDPVSGLPTGAESSQESTIVADTFYNRAGLVNERHYGPGGGNGIATWTYETSSNRMLSANAGTAANPQAWQRLQYTYDEAGNVTRIADAVNAGQRQCFTYDNLDRLTRAFTTGGSNDCTSPASAGVAGYNDTYSYTLGGNLASRTGMGSYVYADPDHVHAVTATSNGSTFAYDDDGNMTARRLAGEPAQTLSWARDQRLVSVAGGSSETGFLYDADGVRVRRVVEGGMTTYYSAGG